MDTKAFLKSVKDSRDDDVAPIVVSGRAISKSDDNLHMCTSSGIVMIPIEDITAVRRTYERVDPNLVNVSVRNAANIQHALRLEILQDTPAAGGPPSDDAPMDLTHWDHGTVTDVMIVDACDATDVFVPPTSFTS